LTPPCLINNLPQDEEEDEEVDDFDEDDEASDDEDEVRKARRDRDAGCTPGSFCRTCAMLPAPVPPLPLSFYNHHTT
jgi:hypothetical protein